MANDASAVCVLKTIILASISRGRERTLLKEPTHGSKERRYLNAQST